MAKSLIEINYAPVVILACLLVFIFTNDYFARRVRMLFLLASILLLCLVVADSMEYWAASLDTLTPIRTLISAIGYSLRPSIIYVVILLLGNVQGRKYAWMAIPLVINTLIAFSAFFTGYAYSYTMDNQFVRGPIGYFAFITSGIYAIALLVCTIKLYKSVRLSETVISVVVLFTFVISTLMESVWNYEGVINVSGTVSLTFYYLYLNTQQFKRDSLTNVLNRRCFYMDAEKNKSNLSAILSIDLNDLKKWNDEYGHAKGDEAICTMVCCVETVLPPNCYLYRVGGDEFMILCFNQQKETIKQLKNKIKENLSQTPFSCAIGIAYNDNMIDFNKMCSQADESMYEDKKLIKQTTR